MRTPRERRLFALTSLAAILGFPVLHQWSSPTAYGTSDPNDPSALRVATYNLNFGLAGEATTTNAVLALEADVLLLQETSDAWREVLEPRLRDRFPYQHWIDAEVFPAGGIAIVSRHPMHDVIRSESAIGWFPALAATIDAPDGPVRMIDVHLKPPVSSSGSLFLGYFSTPSERAREVRAHLDRLMRPRIPTVVAGDLNEARGGSVDVLAEAGFEDAVARHLGRAATWRWRIGPLSLREQLDHLLVDERLEVASIAVLPIGESDHLPIVASVRRR
jgi:vancomycin resistance protein VanJ